MSVLNIILGILLVIGGFSCMFTPFATFLSAGYYIAILLLVYGVFGLVRYFKKESGVLNLIVSILAVVVGIVCLVRPGKTLVIDSLVLTLVAVWMLIQGLVTIIMAFTVRGEQKGWFWGVIVGALAILAGIYSFAHPGLEAMTIGVLIGLYFVEAGFDMIVKGVAMGEARKEAKDSLKESTKE